MLRFADKAMLLRGRCGWLALSPCSGSALLLTRRCSPVHITHVSGM
jgi:hypothetical protein